MVASVKHKSVGTELSQSEFEDITLHELADVASTTDIAVDTNLSVAAQDAITKRHTQNTDTDLSPAHKDATTGVHGVGVGTVAKTVDITATKLDDFATPDNNTDLNASTTRHGLLPILDNVATNFLNGQGGWSVPAGGGGGDPGEGHITILPLSYSAIGAGTWVLGYTTSIYTCWEIYNSSLANLDNISFQVYLAAGTYTLLLVTATAASHAIVDFDVDATEVASFDTYSAGAVYNVRKTQTDIVIATSGLKTLKARVHGRHASATNWEVDIVYIALWRTA